MREIRRSALLREGARGGLVAGAAFAAAELLGAAIAGYSPGVPWQLSASIMLGDVPPSGPITGVQFLLGAVIHFGLAAVFGVIFAAIAYAMGRERRNSYGWMLAAGTVYGLALWVVNFQLLAPRLFPSFLIAGPVAQAAIHALAYGVPLAYWVALRVRDVEVPRVHQIRQEWQTAEEGSAEAACDLRRDVLRRRKLTVPVSARPAAPREARRRERRFPPPEADA